MCAPPRYYMMHEDDLVPHFRHQEKIWRPLERIMGYFLDLFVVRVFPFGDSNFLK